MEKIGLKYGVLTAVGLVVYFLLMRVLGLVHIIELRFFNGVIMAIGVVLAIKAYKVQMAGKLTYFKGLGAGILTAAVSTTLFAAFMLVYIKIGGEALVEMLSADQYFGERVVSTPGVVVFTVLMLEGIISGFMIAFIAMQYFKQNEHKVPGAP